MEKSDEQVGRVPISGSLVHQGSRKVNLEGEGFAEVEGPFAVSVKMEKESCVNVNDGTSEEVFAVTKEGIQSPAAAGDSDGQGERSSCSCRQEIESLKCAVKQLITQTEKQHEMIKMQNRAIIKQKQVVTDMKLSFRNFAISLETCDDEEGDLDGLMEFSETEEAAESTAVGPQRLNRTATTQNTFQDGENRFPVIIVSCTGNYSDGVETQTLLASSSLETFSSEVGYNVGQETNKEDTDDLDHAIFQDDEGEDKNSLYIPNDVDESEEELDQEMEKKENYPGASSTSTKSVKTKRDFQCVKCSKRFETKDYLTNHIRRVHSKKESMSKCHLCSKVCRNVWKLRQHIQSVHEGIRYKCAYCPGKFNHSSHVRRHEDKVHKGGKLTQQCKICGTHLLGSEHSLKSHMGRMHKPTFTKNDDL